MSVSNRVYQRAILTAFCPNHQQYLINLQPSRRVPSQHLLKPLEDSKLPKLTLFHTRTITKMRFISQLVVVLAGLATVHAAAFLDSRAVGKANEYDREGWYDWTEIPLSTH